MSTSRRPFDRNRPTSKTPDRAPASLAPLPEARFQSLLSDVSRFFAQAEQELQAQDTPSPEVLAQAEAQAREAAAAQAALREQQRQNAIAEILATMARYQLSWTDLADD